MSHKQETTDKAEPSTEQREPCVIIRPIDQFLERAALAQTKPGETNDDDPYTPFAA